LGERNSRSRSKLKPKHGTFFESEAEKQSMIWKAFGVDCAREMEQLREASDTFMLRLKSGIMTDDVKEFIEEVVRGEVWRILGRGKR
jgi:hypothetical protein